MTYPSPLSPGAASRRRAGWQILTALAAVVGVTALALAVSRPDHEWSATTRTTFMSSCLASSGGRINACSCVLERLENQLSEQTVASIEANGFPLNSDAAIRRIAESCR